MIRIVNNYGFTNNNNFKHFTKSAHTNSVHNSVHNNLMQSDVIQLTNNTKNINFTARKLDVIPYKNLGKKSEGLIKSILHSKDISSLKKADTAIFMAHPDDEIFFSIIPELIDKGHSVQLIYATGGENGLRYLGAPPAGAELAKYREKELVGALQKLGVNRDAIILDLPDSSAYKGSNTEKMNDAFHNILEKVNPEYVFTFAPNGMTKHPDHIAVGKTVFNLVKNRNKEDKNSTIHLYHTVMSKKSFKKFEEIMKSCNTYSWSYLQYVSNRAVKLISNTQKYAKSIADATYQHRSQWNDVEVKGFNDFYANNKAEFTVLKKFKTPKVLTSPWEQGELKFKKKYGDEFSILLCDGIGFKPKGETHKFNLYLSDFGKNDKTLWVEDPTFNNAKKSTSPIDVSKTVFNSIERIKKIPQFRKLENISFNFSSTANGGLNYNLTVPIKESKKIAPYIGDICKNCELGLNKYKTAYPHSKISIKQN